MTFPLRLAGGGQGNRYHPAMDAATFRLVLLVSCAHALVHVFELSLPSVEQMIGEEFSVGRERTGMLGTCWRLPFGCGALLAGWLADRFGSKPMLIAYLCGCGTTAALTWWSPTLPILFTVMFAMGCFASIYHPAGLAIISRETTPENRGAALGWHGIVGSLGIAGAPFLAAVVFRAEAVTWRMYYAGLVIPACLLAVFIAWMLREQRDEPGAVGRSRRAPMPPGVAAPADSGCWRAFAVLVVSGALSGFVYAAFMHFLPRYLDEAGFRPSGTPPESFRNLLAALVLACGIGGQALAGRLAQPGRLEWLLAGILLASAPLLAWMAVAHGWQRLHATCALAFVHFMNQPVYNSLIAQYVPRVRRSIGYGVSNMLTFGVGAFGPTYAGLAGTQQATYLGLAGAAVLAALLTAGLSWAEAADRAGQARGD